MFKVLEWEGVESGGGHDRGDRVRISKGDHSLISLCLANRIFSVETELCRRLPPPSSPFCPPTVLIRSRSAHVSPPILKSRGMQQGRLWERERRRQRQEANSKGECSEREREREDVIVNCHQLGNKSVDCLCRCRAGGRRRRTLEPPRSKATRWDSSPASFFSLSFFLSSSEMLWVGGVVDRAHTHTQKEEGKQRDGVARALAVITLLASLWACLLLLLLLPYRYYSMRSFLFDRCVLRRDFFGSRCLCECGWLVSWGLYMRSLSVRCVE